MTPTAEQVREHFHAELRKHPHLTTTKGAVTWADLEVALKAGVLVRKADTVENDNEIATSVEYWRDGELVHRSAHVHLKQQLSMQVTPGDFLG